VKDVVVEQHPCIPGALLMRVGDGPLQPIALMAVAEPAPAWWPCWEAHRQLLRVGLRGEVWRPCAGGRWRS
jgi:hypothetical protein